MKRISLILLALITTSAQAFVATCAQFSEVLVNDHSSGFKTERTSECTIGRKKNNPNNRYTVKVTTYGLDLEEVPGFGLITCPLVSKRRLNKLIDRDGSWTIYGLEASASFLLGGTIGVGANKKGAFCTVTGLNVYGVGVRAGAVEVSFSRSE